jgi:hypothetical protein
MFGATYRSHPQGSSSPRNDSNYQPTIRNSPGDGKSHLQCGGSLKSCITVTIVILHGWNLYSYLKKQRASFLKDEVMVGFSK